MTDSVRATISTLPTAAGLAGPRAIGSLGARDALFASLSRELRCTLDHEGRLRHLEGAWHSVLGWQPEQLRDCHWEELVHPADHMQVADALGGLRAGGGSTRELTMRMAVSANGHVPVAWTMIAGPGADHIVGVGRESSTDAALRSTNGTAGATERRDRDLAARLADVEERYTAVERFAAMAAHQLAEPLVIAESSAILVAEELGDGLDPVLRDRLDAIGRGAARARLLIDALLQDARASDQPLERVPVDLEQVVAEAVSSVALRIDDLHGRVVVGALPCVLGDARLLDVVVENLLINALKHGPRRGGTIRIRAERDPGGQRLSIWSDGPAIAERDRRGIFDPFRRLPRERRLAGAGLGLAICTRLVERMGGTIGVEPGEPRGNSFWIVLPAVD